MQSAIQFTGGMYRKRRFQKGGKEGTFLSAGWLPPLPDMRDYSEDHPNVVGLVEKLEIDNDANKLPRKVDLRQWCTPVEDQLDLGSCTANAAVGMLEYFQNRAHGVHIEGSRLFVYKTTRKLMQAQGDSGCWLRSAMGALVLFGVPDEKYFPYTLNGKTVNPDWDSEPDSFLYAMAKCYATINYFCHDPLVRRTMKTGVKNVKKYCRQVYPPCLVSLVLLPSKMQISPSYSLSL